MLPGCLSALLHHSVPTLCTLSPRLLTGSGYHDLLSGVEHLIPREFVSSTYSIYFVLPLFHTSVRVFRSRWTLRGPVLGTYRMEYLRLGDLPKLR